VLPKRGVRKKYECKTYTSIIDTMTYFPDKQSINIRHTYRKATDYQCTQFSHYEQIEFFAGYSNQSRSQLIVYLWPLLITRNSLLPSPIYRLEECKHSRTHIILDEPQCELTITSYVLLVTVLVIL